MPLFDESGSAGAVRPEIAADGDRFPDPARLTRHATGARRHGHYPRFVDPPIPILLVTGPPASGKTFVAGVLADRLRLPLIEKDAIKETLYDSLGTGDGVWSQQLGRATFALIYWAVEVQLKARQPVIVEANFAAGDARPAFRSLNERCPFKPLEFHCTAPDDVLLARYAARAGARHRGHVDMQRTSEIASAVSAGHYRPVRLSSEDAIVIDTTSFDDLDLDALLDAARTHLASVHGEQRRER